MPKKENKLKKYPKKYKTKMPKKGNKIPKKYKRKIQKNKTKRKTLPLPEN